jgi:hypothetical protein
MEPAAHSRDNGPGTIFTVLERIVLFALSASVAVVNLLIGLAVAAHLGVLPKETSGRILRLTSHATEALNRLMSPSSPPAPKHKQKP